MTPATGPVAMGAAAAAVTPAQEAAPMPVPAAAPPDFQARVAMATGPAPLTAHASRGDIQRGAADRAAAERVAAAAERLVAASVAVPQRSDIGDERLKRKVVVSNIPAPAKSTELADFFTGAIFSATGHTLAAQWQSGEASKVVVGVDLLPGTPFGATAAEVTFGTATAATVAIALHGIQFKGKALEIRRPKGYAHDKSKTRAKLQGVSIKDLVAGGMADGSPTTGATATSGGAAANASAGETAGGVNAGGTGNGAAPATSSVLLSGIPSSMSSKSVFDLLQQFGGPLRCLNLAQGAEGQHLGHGSAEYVDRASALEAVGFSPLLGFIEVKLGGAMSPAAPEPQAKRQRKSRFDPVPDEGGDAADDVDLGPFEAVLPPARKVDAAEDLGPFEAVLGGIRPEEDLGPFEAVLPPAKLATAGFDPLEDLGPFREVVANRGR